MGTCPFHKAGRRELLRYYPLAPAALDTQTHAARELFTQRSNGCQWPAVRTEVFHFTENVHLLHLPAKKAAVIPAVFSALPGSWGDYAASHSPYCWELLPAFLANSCASFRSLRLLSPFQLLFHSCGKSAQKAWQKSVAESSTNPMRDEVASDRKLEDYL